MKKFFSTMNPKVKKVLLIGLAIALVVVVYAIPKGSPAPKTDFGDTQATAEHLEEASGLPVVTVLLDLPTEATGKIDSVISQTLSAMPGYGRDFMVHVESVPVNGSERESLISHYRTELMAGKGPDLLICG